MISWPSRGYRFGCWLGRWTPMPVGWVVLALTRRYAPQLYADALREARR